MMQKYLMCALLACLVVAGCGDGQVKVSEDQEKAFRNPPKEPPAAAAEAMKKSMQNVGKDQSNNK